MQSTQQIDKMITAALKEDIDAGDITTQYLISPHSTTDAHVIAREQGIICGLDVFQKIFHRLDQSTVLKFFFKDGDTFGKNDTIVYLTGKTRTLLTGERVALNFISYLSGIATLTRTFIKAVHPLKTKIMDTRKTTPGLRMLEKMAVRCGGGANHRFNLHEMVFIKDNHRIASSRELSIPELVRRARARTSKRIEIEVDNLKEFAEALTARPDIILLDNMRISEMKKAVALKNLTKTRCLLEASGGIGLNNVKKIAETGVDQISIGALTHSARAIDFSMEFMETTPKENH